MADEQKSELGPSFSFSTLVLRVLAAIGGGTAGSLLLIVIFLLGSSLLKPLTEQQEPGIGISPIFVFILITMVFLSTTIGNILSTWLISLTEKDKYKRVSSAIYQVFILSIIIFILSAPVYFLAANINTSIIGYAVALHIVISAQVSALILEIVSNYRYSLIGVYATTFGILISAGILFGLSNIILSPAILLFVALPIVWGSISLMHGVVSIVYGSLAKTYDKDFLSTQTIYGADYGKDVEEEPVEQAPKAKDEEGADFLRHN